MMVDVIVYAFIQNAVYTIFFNFGKAETICNEESEIVYGTLDLLVNLNHCMYVNIVARLPYVEPGHFTEFLCSNKPNP